MSKGTLKLREFLDRLKSFGVIAFDSRRGKGSEIILVRPVESGSKKGPQFPIKNHGKGTEIYGPVIDAALRRFGIDKKEFWEGKPSTHTVAELPNVRSEK
jgi:hypothetical protein